MTELIETDAQAEARIRATKTRRALLLASEAAIEMALRVLPINGETEPGEEVRAARIPFRGRTLDDLNELYGALVETVLELAEHLQQDKPVAAAAAVWQSRYFLDAIEDDAGDVHEVQQRIDTVYGLPPRFTASGARDLVRSLAVWLTARMDQLLTMPEGPELADGLTRLVWRMRHRYELVTPTTRQVLARRCEVCGSEMVVTYFGEPFANAEARNEFRVVSNAEERRDPTSRAGRLILDVLAGVTVACSVCNWAPQARPQQIARWMEGDRRDRPGDHVLPPGRRDLTDPKDTLWTVEQAATHFMVKPRTIRAWIRDGSVAEHTGGWLRRDELLAAFIAARKARNAGHLR